MRKIRRDVESIMVKRYVFREIQQMVRDNPRIQVPSVFWRWLRDTYYRDVSLSLRRIVDKDRRAVSFWRLLTDIAEHPTVLSRKRYVGRESGLQRERMDEEFDSLAGRSRRHMSRSKVLADRRRLMGATEPVKKFVDQRVAHRDRQGPRRIPTVKDVDSRIEVLEQLTLKYAILLLKEGGVLMPTFTYDWKRPFREPWIPQATKDPSQGHL